MLVELDPRCATCQPEDRLLVLDGRGRVTHVLSLAPENWPKAPLVVPGRSLRLELHSATDYEDNGDAAARWGFRASITPQGLGCPALGGGASAVSAAALGVLHTLQSEGLALWARHAAACVGHVGAREGSWLGSQAANAAKLGGSSLFGRGLLRLQNPPASQLEGSDDERTCEVRDSDPGFEKTSLSCFEPSSSLPRSMRATMLSMNSHSSLVATRDSVMSYAKKKKKKKIHTRNWNATSKPGPCFLNAKPLCVAWP